jgi:hypothetical protein
MNDSYKHYVKGHEINLTSDVKNSLYREALRLKQQIMIGMVSQDELHPVRIARKVIDGVAKDVSVVDEEKMRQTRVVARNTAWYNKNEVNLREFKRIMRVLEPDDPHATKIVESWRPKSHVVKKEE